MAFAFISEQNKLAHPNLNYVWDTNSMSWVKETQPGGSSSSGVIVDGVDSNIKATVFDFTNSNPLAVRLTDTNGDYVSAGGGTEYTEDAASPADPIGKALTARRRDTLGAETTTDGDWVIANSTNKGELYVKHVDNVPVIGTKTNDSAAPGATNVGVLPAIAKASVSSYTDGNQVALATDTQGNLRITAANTDGILDAILANTDALVLTVDQEDQPLGADPFGVGLIARTRTSPPASEGTPDGDAVALNATNKGELYVKQVDTVNVAETQTDTDDGSIFGGLVSPRTISQLYGWDGANWGRVDINSGSLNVNILSNQGLPVHSVTTRDTVTSLGALNASVTINSDNGGTASTSSGISDTNFYIPTGLVGTINAQVSYDNITYLDVPIMLEDGTVIPAGVGMTKFPAIGSLIFTGNCWKARLIVSSYTSGSVTPAFWGIFSEEPTSAIEKVGPIAQAQVNDTVSSFTTGTIQPLQLTSDGRLRVATVSESTNFASWGNPNAWDNQDNPLQSYPSPW